MAGQSLLLLPLPPRTASRRSISANYQQPLASVLSHLKNPNHSSILVIAVVGSFLQQASGDHAGEQRIPWSQIQATLSSLYSLVAFLSAKQSIASDADAGPNSVDVRLVFVHSGEGSGKRASGNGEFNGTIIRDLATFARVRNLWDSVFYLKTQEGRSLLDAYTKVVGERGAQHRTIGLECASSTHSEAEPESPRTNTGSTNGYSVVCLGGTFDHLHPGHKLLLSAAAILLKVPQSSAHPSRFIIGVTGDELLKNKKYAEYVQSWEVRARSVLDFLHSFIDCENEVGPRISSKIPTELTGSYRNGSVIVECVEIQEPFGPTITVEDMDALIVSGETRSGGQAVNDKRKEMGWKEVKVYEVDVLDAQGIASDEPSKTEDWEAKISSTAIREQRAKAGAGSGRL